MAHARGLVRVGADLAGRLPEPAAGPSEAHRMACERVLFYEAHTMRITSKGQVTIPVDVRERLGLRAHTGLTDQRARCDTWVAALNTSSGTRFLRRSYRDAESARLRHAHPWYIHTYMPNARTLVSYKLPTRLVRELRRVSREARREMTGIVEDAVRDWLIHNRWLPFEEPDMLLIPPRARPQQAARPGRKALYPTSRAQGGNLA